MREKCVSDDLPRLLWLWMPLVSATVMLLSPLMGRELWLKIMAGEKGFVETATVILLLPAIVLAFGVFLKRRLLPRGVGILALLLGLACLYFAGEEASWGQHWIGFKTPAGFEDINDQGEFNLHNLRGLDVLNNVPRQAMLWLTVFFGGLLPLVLPRKGRLADPASAWYWLIPTRRLIVVSVLAAVSTVPEKLLRPMVDKEIGRSDYLFMAFIDRSGEFKEYCFAMVLLLYSVLLYQRLKASALRLRCARPS